jgi:bacterioferritin
MDKAKVIEKFNQAVALELTGLLQYNQYAQVVLGPDRRLWADFFKESADESLEHARLFASKVVALGGVPTVETEPVKQSADAREMLEISLAHERRAVAIYTEALALCEDSPAYRNILEDQIQQETEDCEEIEKSLNQIPTIGAAKGDKRSSKSA